jgi:hypothetical protein
MVVPVQQRFLLGIEDNKSSNSIRMSIKVFFSGKDVLFITTEVTDQATTEMVQKTEFHVWNPEMVFGIIFIITC